MKHLLHKLSSLRLLMLLAVLLGMGSGTAWAQSDKSAVYTSNVTLSTTGGTSASAAQVSISSTNYDAIKAGTGKVAGAVRITVPAGTKHLHLHAAAWNGETVNISLAPNGNLNASYLALTADASIKNNTPFTLSSPTKAPTDYYKVLTFKTALTSDTNITFTAGANSTGGKRFVIWGVNAEAETAAVTHTLTYSAINGSIAGVDDGSDVVASGDDVAESATVTLTATPSPGYVFSSWNVSGTDATLSSTSTNPTTFTMGTANATVTANFDAAGDYISASPTTQNITYAGGDAEFTISTDQTLDDDPTQFYTTADGDVTTTKPAWITEVLYDEGTLLLSVEANTGAARTAYFRVENGNVKSDVITINQAAYVAVTSVALDITSKSLLVEGTVTLNATVSPDNATNKNVTWESDDESVATVNEDGVVTAVAEGTATITAKSVADPTKSATCTITVTDGSIDLRTTGEITISSFPSFSGSGYQSPNPYTIGDYDWIAANCMLSSSYLQLKASTGKLTSPTIKSANGFTVTVTVPTNSVTVSDGTSSASTTDGVATLTTTKESTTITITAGGSYAQVSKIKITPSKAPVATEVAITDPGTLAVGAEGTFAYTASSEEGNTASWSSATTSVINITNASTGAYTAAARGTSKITLTLTPTDATTYREVTEQRTITVTEPVVISATDIAIATGSDPVAIGATTTAGYEGTLSYESGNASIATVDASGNVTAVAVGSTTITISAPADASNYFSSANKVINVTVSSTIPVAGVSLKANTTIEKDETETLTPTFTPSTASNKNVSWESDDESVATVDDAGVVTGVAAGTANITVTTEDGGFTATCKVTVTLPKGTVGNPYTVAEVIAGNASGKDDIYAIGYIVGEYQTPSKSTTTVKTSSFSTDANIALADDPTTTALASSIPVAMPTAALKTAWGNQINVGATMGYKVLVKGNGETYFTVNGIKGTSEVSAVSVGVSVGAAGYTTITTKYPTSFEGTGVTAYKATAVNPTTIHLEAIDEAPADEALVIKASEGRHTDIPVIPSAEDINDNLLQSSDGTVTGNLSTIFALGKKNDVVGFYLVNSGQTVPAGKAYLEVDGSNTKGFTFDFDGLATGINTVQGSGFKVQDSKIYNLAGQRVDGSRFKVNDSGLKTGIYIVNGKKVLVK